MIRRVLIVWALWLAGAALGAENALTATVRAVEGRVMISRDEGRTWRKAKAGDQLKPETRLKTESDGTADVELGRKYALVRLRGNSDLEMLKHGITAGNHETQLALKSGTMLGTIRNPVALGAKFEVESQEWVCAVRGKDFEIKAAGGGKALPGTTVVFVFTEFNELRENAFLHGGNAASVEQAERAPRWVERVLDSTEHEALSKEIGELRKKHWEKESKRED